MSTAIDTNCEIAPCVFEFAKLSGVSEELPRVLAMTQEVFPGSSIRAELEDDPELGDRHITVVVERHVMSVKDLFTAH